MKKKFSWGGFIILLVISTGCAPLPHRPPHAPAQQHQRYTTPATKHPQYSSPANYSPAIETRQSIVKLAYQQLGIRYKYGGSSPREGFDCSGLMNYLHKEGARVNIPRTASQQQNRSHTVQYANLQPGDMLFFKTSSKTNHVGVYIGNRQFIHAPNRRSKVKITTMDNAYWQSKFVKFGTFLSK
jgi:cell wall-associated NlpC family hydrolase